MKIEITLHALELLKSLGWKQIMVEAPYTTTIAKDNGNVKIETPAKVHEGNPKSDVEHEWNVYLISGINCCIRGCCIAI